MTSCETDTESQEREEFIETDRNSFTFAPMTPGAGRLIFESAYSYINIGNEGAKHSFPESVFRYGIGDRLELRLGYNFETGRAKRRRRRATSPATSGSTPSSRSSTASSTRSRDQSPDFTPHASQCVPCAAPHADRLG